MSTEQNVVQKQRVSETRVFKEEQLVKSIKKSKPLVKKDLRFEEDVVYYVSTQDEREILSGLIDFQPSSFGEYFD